MSSPVTCNGPADHTIFLVQSTDEKNHVDVGENNQTMMIVTFAGIHWKM